MGRYIDVAAIVTQKRQEITQEVNCFKSTYQRTPCAKIILVGENPASISYVQGKKKAAAETGIAVEILSFPETVTEQELLSVIESLNNDEAVDGILVQLPLPKHIDVQKINASLHPMKDLDGFHPINQGNLLLETKGFVPCTPRGIIEILHDVTDSLVGKHIVVIGKSQLVGKPFAMLALNEQATVTICHSKTKNLEELTRFADILVVAIGDARYINERFVKKDAIVIDVGINRDEKTNKIIGDVDAHSVLPKAALLTPVPGGVGPMTITMLLDNILIAAKENILKKERKTNKC